MRTNVHIKYNVSIYNLKKTYMDLKIKLFFLVVDPQLLSEAGGDMLIAKIPSPNKIEQLKFQPGMFLTLQAGSLLVADCRLLENLRDATVQAVQDDLFKIIFFPPLGKI